MTDSVADIYFMGDLLLDAPLKSHLQTEVTLPAHFAPAAPLLPVQIPVVMGPSDGDEAAVPVTLMGIEGGRRFYRRSHPVCIDSETSFY